MVSEEEGRVRVKKLYEVDGGREVEAVVNALVLSGAERIEIEKVYAAGLSGVATHDDVWKIRAEFEADE